MESQENSEKPVDTENRQQKSIRYFMSGNILTSDFFRGQLFLFLLLCVIAIFYIDNRFACEQQIVKINRLKEQLTNEKYESLTTSSVLMQISRQSQVSIAINTKGIDLQASPQPAIKVE